MLGHAILWHSADWEAYFERMPPTTISEEQGHNEGKEWKADSLILTAYANAIANGANYLSLKFLPQWKVKLQSKETQLATINQAPSAISNWGVQASTFSSRPVPPGFK